MNADADYFAAGKKREIEKLKNEKKKFKNTARNSWLASIISTPSANKSVKIVKNAKIVFAVCEALETIDLIRVDGSDKYLIGMQCNYHKTRKSVQHTYHLPPPSPTPSMNSYHNVARTANHRITNNNVSFVVTPFTHHF